MVLLVDYLNDRLTAFTIVWARRVRLQCKKYVVFKRFDPYNFFFAVWKASLTVSARERPRYARLDWIKPHGARHSRIQRSPGRPCSKSCESFFKHIHDNTTEIKLKTYKLVFAFLILELIVIISYLSNIIFDDKIPHVGKWSMASTACPSSSLAIVTGAMPILALEDSHAVSVPASWAVQHITFFGWVAIPEGKEDPLWAYF